MALEKTTSAQHHTEKVQKPRIESLQQLSEHYNADPYSLSAKARKRFREEKKLDKLNRAADSELKGRYGLPEDLSLAAENEATRREAKEAWEKQRDSRLSKRPKTDSAFTTVSNGSLKSTFFHSRRPATGSRSAAGKSNTTLSLLGGKILQNTTRQSTKPARV